MKSALILASLALLCTPALAQSLDRSELPESAYTAGKGKVNLHMDGYQSAVGLTDQLDIGTRVLPSYFGANLQVRYAVIQDDTHALSLEPLFWMEWPWAELGHPSNTFGAMVRYSRSMGPGRLNFAVGIKRDSLKVTLRETKGDELVEGKGVEVTPEFSLTLLRAPFVFHEDATKTKDGWDFQGVRVPIVLGYELPVSDKANFHTAIRVHPLNIAKGGSWAVEIHPSFSGAVGKRFRLGAGLNVLAPGVPFPIADADLAKEIADEEGSDDFNAVMEKIPQAGAPVFVLPTLGIWWRI